MKVRCNNWSDTGEVGHLDASRVRIELASGMKFTLSEEPPGVLSIHANGQLVVIPHVSNVIYVKEET